MEENKSQIIIYQTENGEIKLRTKLFGNRFNLPNVSYINLF